MSYTNNPTGPKYNMAGRYLTEYMNSSNFCKGVVVFSS